MAGTRYLHRLGITSGQACTLSIGLVLGGVLLAASVPPVWDRRAQAEPRPVDGAPQGGALTGLAPPPPVAAPAPAALPPEAEPAEPLAPLVVPPPDAPLADEPPEPPPAQSPPDLGPSTAEQPTPLQVVESGYSTPDPASAAVPEDGLPIGARLGSRAETSYVRLDGTATTLRLAVSSDDGSSFGPDAPRVKACRIGTAGWKAERPGPPVGYDGSVCAPGIAQPGGSYAFDLGRFADRSDRRGFALVADPRSSTATFRLTLTARSTP